MGGDFVGVLQIMEKKDGVANWVLLGLGFNAFNQLSTQDEESPSKQADTGSSADTEFAVYTPKPLMTVSSQAKPDVQISSTWDSMHVSCTSSRSTEEQFTQTATTGRWREVLDKSGMMSLLNGCIRGELTGVVEVNNNLVLNIPPSIFTITQDFKSDKTSINMQEQLPKTTSFSVLADGRVYTLLENGDLHKCDFTATSDKESVTPAMEQLDKYSLSLGPRIPTNGVPVSKVFCGADHILLLSQTGSLFSFGLNSRGQLGHGDIVTRPQPTLVVALDGIVVKDIACGHWHCLVVSEFGDVYSWGWNKHRQLGHSEQTPTVAIPTLVELQPSGIVESTGTERTAVRLVASEDVNIVSVSCGARHSVVLSDTGEVYGWGWNGYGQLGGKRNELVVTFPRRISLPDCVFVYCSHWNTMFCCVS